MKLLSPTELQETRSKEQRLEVEQGMGLAKRVDTLRETLAKEEQNLERFRTETTKTVMDELAALDASKNAVMLEVESLTASREKLRIPLDSAWEALREAQNAHSERSLSLEAERLQLDQDKAVLEADRTFVDNQKKRVETMQSDAQAALDDANRVHNQTAIEAEDFRKEQDAWREKHDRIMRSIEDKERTLGYDIEHQKDFGDEKKRTSRLEVLKKRLYGKNN